MKKVAIYFLLLLLPINTLLPIPLDKVALVGISILGAWVILERGILFSTLSLITLFFVFLCISLSISVNILSFAPIIVYPLLGVLYINVYTRLPYPKINDWLYTVLSYNSIVGLALWAMSYLIGLNPFVRPLIDKNMPFVHAAQGFCSTPQVFGTLCLTAVFIYIIKKQHGQHRQNRFFLITNALGIFASVNRVSILLFLFMLIFINRKIFATVLALGIGAAVYFFNVIKENLLNVSTLQSRSDLLYGFDLSFFYYNNPLGFLFGKGDPYLDERSFVNSKVDSAYVENGTAALIHLYGAVGFFLYLGIAAFLLFYAIKWRAYFIAFVIFLYMLVVPQFTHEYYSSSFYILLAAMLTAINNKDAKPAPLYSDEIEITSF
ncbi:hypothetical protein [Olivibacter jilunii]|uniref:hypothetical protein n=1 Tax=Olivibacter jilunii TaxID=985016 RepID=UPI003F18313D